MKQLSQIMSTYSPDLSGVCSALYELGGMVVIHDASGCNSTYTTFDEPRWYDMDSLIFGSGLVETDAILGNDEKLIGDVVSAAADLHPKFITVAGSPVPMMIGMDFTGIARLIENRTGIPAFGFSTNGMNYYCSGAGMAFEAIARRFCTKQTPLAGSQAAVNLIGATPLDFSIKGNIESLRALFEERGYKVVSVWAMGSSLEEISAAGKANVNVAVASSGLPAARFLRETYGTPFVAGLPIGNGATEKLFKLVDAAASDKKDKYLQNAVNDFSKACRAGVLSSLPCGARTKTLIIGEQIFADSLRSCLASDYGLRSVHALCPLDPDPSLLLPGDIQTDAESEIKSEMADFDIIIGDPLYRRLLPPESGKRFIDMPHHAFSGRIYTDESPIFIGEKIHEHLMKYFSK